MVKEKPTTKTCKHCKTEIPYDAKVCPQCRKKQKGGCLPVILICIVALIIFAIAGGSDDNDSSDKKSTSAQKETSEKVESTEAKSDVPKEYESALNKAYAYSESMHMSKQGIYDQLVSEYGEQFSEEAAQYAIDNIKADWKANALASAKQYQDTMDMSPSAIHDQLTSEYGEQFTKEEADYAIEHLND